MRAEGNEGPYEESDEGADTGSQQSEEMEYETGLSLVLRVGLFKTGEYEVVGECYLHGYMGAVAPKPFSGQSLGRMRGLIDPLKSFKFVRKYS